MGKKISILICVAVLLGLGVRQGSAEVIDRIVATVNGRVILLSDWEDSLRYEAFSGGQPLDRITTEERKAALDRLIDQELLREQQPAADPPHASPEEVAQRVAEIRKQYAAAETELGWKALLDKYRLSEETLRHHVALELDLMRLVDARLRPSVTVDSKSIESYYKQELLPQLRQSGAQSVPLAEVTGKIKELLIQKKISQLLTTWLHNLRAGSQIRGEAFAPASEGRNQ
ncbi:MAG: SurA N-terminal domain-containing protein [Terriglobales bacterium]